MASTEFIPYWHQVESKASDPNSWVFFVVTNIAGLHRPVAVVSSISGNYFQNTDETVRGRLLPVICHRILTIFSDSSNWPLIKSENSIAHQFYLQNDATPRIQPVSLPEYDRLAPDKNRHDPWKQDHIFEFPFTTACLLQGVGCNPDQGLCNNARPEPLNTIFTDTSLEWGMVIFDITDLAAIRYGIVGFGVARMTHIANEGMEGPFNSAHFEWPYQSELRLIDDTRPRVAMSAHEYMVKFDGFCPSPWDLYRVPLELLANVPIIDSAVMDSVWPKSLDDENSDSALTIPLVVAPNTDFHKILSAQAMRKLIRDIFRENPSGEVDFESLQSFPNFGEPLRKWLMLSESELYATSASSGLLARIALFSKGHLDLSLFKLTTIEALSTAIYTRTGFEDVTSVSLCAASFQGSAQQLVHCLLPAPALNKLYLLESPHRNSDDFSREILRSLVVDMPSLNYSALLFTGSFSAALCKRPWIHGGDANRRNGRIGDIEKALLGKYPIQHVIVRRTSIHGYPDDFSYIYLGNTLLEAEGFASGLILYLRSIVNILYEGTWTPSSGVWAFSSAPASLEYDSMTAAEIKPMPSEYLEDVANGRYEYYDWVGMRDLVPTGWTAVITVQEYRSFDQREQGRFVTAHSVEYALVRPRYQQVSVGSPPSPSLHVDNLEVVDLQEFLAMKAPTVRGTLVRQRLEEVKESLRDRLGEGVLDPAINRLRCLSPSEASQILSESITYAQNLEDI